MGQDREGAAGAGRLIADGRLRPSRGAVGRKRLGTSAGHPGFPWIHGAPPPPSGPQPSGPGHLDHGRTRFRGRQPSSAQPCRPSTTRRWDPRTAVIFCCRFNDAPGTGSKVLLEHMKQTSSERFDTGKVSILSLPRSGEALEMKDDTGESALNDDEGYEFKRMQVEGELQASDMPGVPLFFFNVEGDDSERLRGALFGQLARIRSTDSERLIELCAAATKIIENREQHAVTVAIEEVARRLNTFLLGNDKLGGRERHAYGEALSTVRAVQYASTLWASTRRNGEYSGLNIVHQVGVGAAKDARLRSRDWFAKIDGHVNELKADSGLEPAMRSIEQIRAVAAASRRVFLAGAQRIAMEIYREPLTQADVWSKCAAEWGGGPGFRDRVVRHLQEWFEDRRPALKETLEARLDVLWQRSVIAPLMRLAEEQEPNTRESA